MRSQPYPLLEEQHGVPGGCFLPKLFVIRYYLFSDQRERKMRFVIITGMSGAGKSNAVRILEDIGYFVVDNMLPSMVPSLAKIAVGSQGKMDKIALVCDIRSGDNFYQLSKALDNLTEESYQFEILFLDAKDDYLINRYKETRRSHPFSADCLLSDAIRQEREMLNAIKQKATYTIDTSKKTLTQVRKKLEQLFSEDKIGKGMVINIVSFGFKYGLPLDCDLVFDARFLPNPFYIPKLKTHNGTEKPIKDYVMGYEQSVEFEKKLKEMLDYLLPFYELEGKSQLVIGIGCTGGHHRSVCLAENLFRHLKKKNRQVFITHREQVRWTK